MVSILNAPEKTVIEFPGIMANPAYTKEQEGEALARELGVDEVNHCGFL